MGADIYGWVEVYKPSHGNWMGIVKIRCLVHRSYGLFSYFFGLRRQPGDPDPIAAERGLPSDISEEADSDRDVPHVMPSWISWEELSHIDWQTLDNQMMYDRRTFLTPDWRVLLQLMASLAIHFGGDKVRLVVWFDQL